MIGYLSMAVLSLIIGLGLYIPNIVPIASLSFSELKSFISNMPIHGKDTSTSTANSYLDSRCSLVKHLAGDHPFQTTSPSSSTFSPPFS